MIIVVLKNPDPDDPERRGTDVELRILVQGMTLDEADMFGEAINEFAVRMKRFEKLDAFTMNQEMLVH